MRSSAYLLFILESKRIEANRGTWEWSVPRWQWRLNGHMLVANICVICDRVVAFLLDHRLVTLSDFVVFLLLIVLSAFESFSPVLGELLSRDTFDLLSTLFHWLSPRTRCWFNELCILCWRRLVTQFHFAFPATIWRKIARKIHQGGEKWREKFQSHSG